MANPVGIALNGLSLSCIVSLQTFARKSKLSENKDSRVEHLVASRLLQVGSVCSIVLFLRFVTSKRKIFNRRDVLP